MLLIERYIERYIEFILCREKYDVCVQQKDGCSNLFLVQVEDG